MKKIIKQDGTKRVFIYDDGSEVSFDNAETVSISEPKPTKKKKKKFNNKRGLEELAELEETKEG